MEKEYCGPSVELLKEIEKLFAKIKPPWDEIRFKSEAALKLDPRCYPAYYYLGKYEQEMNNYDKMEAFFLEALEKADNPHNDCTWDGIVITLYDELMDYDRLVRYLYEFIKKQPDYFAVKYLTEILWKNLNRKDKALLLLDDYISIYPGNKKAIKLRDKIAKDKTKAYTRFSTY